MVANRLGIPRITIGKVIGIYCHSYIAYIIMFTQEIIFGWQSFWKTSKVKHA